MGTMYNGTFATGKTYPAFTISGTFNAPFIARGDGSALQWDPMSPKYVTGSQPVYWQYNNASGFDPAGMLYYYDAGGSLYTGAPVEYYQAAFSVQIAGLTVQIDPLNPTANKCQWISPFGGGLSVTLAMPATSTPAVNVSWSLSFPAVEYVTFNNITDGEAPGNGPRGGTGAAVKRTRYIVIPTGSVITLSFTNQGGTVSSSSAPTTSPITFNIGSATLTVKPEALGAQSRTATATLQVNGIAYNFNRTKTYSAAQGAPNGTQIFLAETASYDYTNGISVTTTGGGYYYASGVGPFQHPPVGSVLGGALLSGRGASFTSLPPKQCSLVGTLYAPGNDVYEDAPQLIDFYCRGGLAPIQVPANPSCNYTYIQRSGSINEWGLTNVYTIAEQGPIYAIVDSSINAVGDIPDAIKARDKTYDAITIEHLPSLTIDPFDGSVPGTWTHSNATVTTGSYVSIAATSTGGSGKYTYSGTYKSLEAYRFANIVLNTQVGSNVPLTIQINGKSWNVTSGTFKVDKTVQIDLCCPDSQDGSATANWDTAYPRITQDGTAVADSPNGGVGAVKIFSVQGIPNGETVEVKSLTGVRTTRALLDVMEQGSSPYYAITSAGSPGSRLLLADVDGHQGIEMVCNSNPASISMVDFSISQLAASINLRPGWTCTDLAPTHAYYNNAQPAAYLCGAANAGALGIDVSSATTIQAVSLFDSCDTYPGDHDGNTLNFVVWERGIFHGLALTNYTGTGQPMPGASVSTNPNCGSATADSLAYFECLEPYMKPIVTYTLPPIQGTLRKKNRSSSTSNCLSPYILQMTSGRMAVSCIKSGDIRFRWSPFSVPLYQIDTTITSNGGWAQAPFCEDSRGRIELRSFHKNQGRSDTLATGVYRLWSDDNGATWGPQSGGSLAPELVLASATQVSIRSASDGTIVEISFVPDSGTTGPGTFSVRMRGPGQTSFTATPYVPVDDSGNPLHSDGSGWNFDKAHEGPARWSLTMVAYGDTDSSVWFSSDYPDCTTFKRF